MFCPNDECPDFVNTGLRSEYRDDVMVCPYCGSTMVAERPEEPFPDEDDGIGFSSAGSGAQSTTILSIPISIWMRSLPCCGNPTTPEVEGRTLGIRLRLTSIIGLAEFDDIEDFDVNSVDLGAILPGIELLFSTGQRSVLRPFVDPSTLSRVIAGSWARGAAKFKGMPGFAEVFMPAGKTPAEGELFANPALARTLDLITEGGRDAFYRGEIAEEIVANFAGEPNLDADGNLIFVHHFMTDPAAGPIEIVEADLYIARRVTP